MLIVESAATALLAPLQITAWHALAVLGDLRGWTLDLGSSSVLRMKRQRGFSSPHSVSDSDRPRQPQEHVQLL